MKRVYSLMILPLFGVLFLSSEGCHKSKSTFEPTKEATGTISEPEPIEPKTLTQGELAQNQINEISKQLQPIFFDYDKANIRPDQVVALDKNNSILKNYPSVKLLLEGHCDERGTEEYNLALGERRAKSVKDYLIDLGIEENRIRTISYGESRPFAYDHNENAWQQNRRGQPVAVRSDAEPSN